MASANGGGVPFLISGGGIGGLVTAYALARHGFAVRVFEQSAEFKEVGAGIQLGPNVFRVLEKIGLKAEILADAHRPPAQEMRNALTGKLIANMPLDEKFMARFGQPYAVTHRADIHGTFLKACQNSNLITLENNRRVDGYDDHGDGVSVTLEGGERVEGRGLIACDGMWSMIREKIVGDGKPRVSGHIAYRAVLKRDEVPKDLWRPDVVLWAGPRTHFVHYPLRRGELYNLVAVFHSDHYEEGWNAEGTKDVMWQHFKMQVPQVTRMLELINTWRMWVLCDREPVKNWNKGRVVLLGDAAHPMLQYLAQGACMAAEDAVVLADKIAETPDDPAKAFEAYKQARYLRTARTQIMARVYGEFYHAGGVAGELRDMAIGGRTNEQALDGIAWLYGGP
ncbi:MAG: 3-hydroxybenzoate 6-monooxygenase [Pseudolabrys sp.]